MKHSILNVSWLSLFCSHSWFSCCREKRVRHFSASDLKREESDFDFSLSLSPCLCCVCAGGSKERVWVAFLMIHSVPVSVHSSSLCPSIARVFDVRKGREREREQEEGKGFIVPILAILYVTGFTVHLIHCVICWEWKERSEREEKILPEEESRNKATASAE